MPSGIDFYSQSRELDDEKARRAKQDKGSLMNIIALVTAGRSLMASAPTKAAGLSKKFAAQQAAEFGSKAALGGVEKTITSSGGQLVATQALKSASKSAMAQFLQNNHKQEGLSTLVNNVLTPSGSGVIEGQSYIQPNPSANAYSDWQNQKTPQSKGSFLGGLKKGALGMPQEASDTSPWFYAGALIPSVIRSKLGVDTTFEAAYRNKMGDYYEAAGNGYDIGDNLTPERRKKLMDSLKSRLPGYVPGKNKAFFNDETGEFKYE